MRRPSRRGSPLATPAKIFLTNIYSLYLFPKNAAVKPPGAASCGPSRNIFIFFAAKPHHIINTQIPCELFYIFIVTELFYYYFGTIYITSLGSMPSNVPAVYDVLARP
jgi:hypothetical protein